MEKKKRILTGVLNVISHLAAAIGLFVFVYALIPRPCDIDKIYLHCRISPFTFADGIGMGIFLFGCVGLTFMLDDAFIWLSEKAGCEEGAFKLISLLSAAVGVGIMWAL